MAKVSLAQAAALFLFSILSLVVCITMVSLNVGLSYTGFNLSAVTVSCSGQAYLNSKFGVLYLALRAQTITGLISVCLAVPVLILMLKIYWPLRELSGEALEQSKVDQKYTISLFILASAELVCLISNAGGKLSLYIDNRSCTIAQTRPAVILFAISALTLLIGLVQWLLIAWIGWQSGQGQDLITLRDLQNNDEVVKEEDAMSKHFEKHMKEYFSSNLNQKQEMMEGLLKRENEIYGGHTYPLTSETQGSTVPAATGIASPPTQGSEPTALDGTEGDQGKGKSSQRKKKNKAGVMHSYGTFTGADKDNYQGQQDYIQEESEEGEEGEGASERNKIDEHLLHATFDDNLSEKFDENNFELDYDLERAIRYDEEEDLSPLELRELMHLTRASFLLKGSNDRCLLLEKTYENPENFKINVSFAKIKAHKSMLQSQTQRLIDEPNPAETPQSNEKEESKKVVEDSEEKPITEQTSKLLKIMLFNNSQFYKRKEEKQTECPISKYVQNDDGFEIIQTNEKGKHKKVEYSKEQLLFSKKRKETNDDHLKDKGTVRQEFNEAESIRMERLMLFGQEWLNEHEQNQSNAERTKSHKRKLVEVIRSKYYQ